ncbi:calphotin-like isoform X3 [Stegastes partitus]|uniref:Calphotin-like isoform X3 n=1 Tax=Stegastes partitus TaxID=144197 RepID=A0A9Y4JZL3_9TELE|nr:PREDICTED: calphotin-like isoform X3 [Stegastes partitus]
MGLVFSWLWGQKEAPLLLDVATEAQVIPPAEVPVVVPAETEIQTVDTTVIQTETEQTFDVCEPETEVEAEAVAEAEAVEAEAVAEEDTVTEVEVVIPEDIVIPEPEIEITEEPAVEVISSEPEPAEAEADAVADEVVTETVAESVVEVISEVPEPEQVTEAVVSPAAPAEEEEEEEGDDEGEVEVLVEEDAPEVPAEPVTMPEDALVQSVEVPVVPDTIPEALVEEAEPVVTETKEAVADTLVDDFVVTESVSAVEVAIAESAAAIEQEIVAPVEPPSTQTESMDVTPAEPEPEPEPEPVAVPAEEMIIDAATEQKCLNILSEEPKPELCDMPCQMQLAVESVQLGSVELSVEAAMNGHIVPEVSIEG